MKRLLGDIRRADADFGLIARGDRVAAAVSGGKDSQVMLRALAVYSRFAVKPFELVAITLKMGEPFDVAPITALCRELGVPHIVQESDMLRQLFEVRKEANPCALCARVRRGALLRMAAESGCAKLALGHHREDAEETLLMSVLHESRLRTFAPLTRMGEHPVAVIRPMIYAKEKEIARLARRLAVPVVPNPCPLDGRTARQDMKELLKLLCQRYPRARESLLTALRDTQGYGLWARPGDEE